MGVGGERGEGGDKAGVMRELVTKSNERILYYIVSRRNY
jgi:hypothetical protein